MNTDCLLGLKNTHKSPSNSNVKNMKRVTKFGFDTKSNDCMKILLQVYTPLLNSHMDAKLARLLWSAKRLGKE